MASQPVAYILGMFAAAGTAATTFWNQWSVSGPHSESFIDPVGTWIGLWEKCSQNTGEQYTCTMEVSIFEIKTYLIALRFFMCTAMLLSFFACLITLLGLECSRILEDQLNKKRKLMFISGFMHAVAAVLVLVSVAWYTAMVVTEYFSFENQDNVFRYELGGAIYLGYGSFLVSLLAALCCFCMPGEKEERNSYVPTTYKPATSYASKPAIAEYV